jgi:plasmid maintenance system killer protein
MIILPLTPKQNKYLHDHNLTKKYTKQINIFLSNIHHPGLNLELLEPRNKGIYSFRLDIHYRVLFVFYSPEVVEIIVITNHYK